MQSQTKKTILVTGGAGYIGSAIVAGLIEIGHTVVIFDDLSCGRKDKLHTDAFFVQGDVTNKNELLAVFKQYSFDVVIHCAAKKILSESEENPTKYYTNNVGGTLNVLSCMDEFHVPKIIFSSTAAVYAPNEDGHPVLESDPVDPTSVYGRSKLIGEMLIRDFARLQKISSYTIFRYFNVAGDGGLQYMELNSEGVFPMLARAFKEGKPFSVFGTSYATKDGSAVRDYIDVYDVASAHVLAIGDIFSGIFNLGTSAGYTVFELLQTFTSLTGKNVAVIKQDPRKGEIPVMLADASYARMKLGWAPVRTLEEMVKSTIDLYGI